MAACDCNEFIYKDIENTWGEHYQNSKHKVLSVFNHSQETQSVHSLPVHLESLDDLLGHIPKEAGSVIHEMAYEHSTEPHGNDPCVDLVAKRMVQFAEATMPGRWKVDILLFCTFASLANV